MGLLSGFRYRDVTKRLRLFGFVFDRHAAGSHEIWSNKSTGRYTPGDIPEGTLRSILKQANIDPDEFLEL
jgi:predicted RNA binding protein YcfA (HicA-like mRNA interferase family)